MTVEHDAATPQVSATKTRKPLLHVLETPRVRVFFHYFWIVASVLVILTALAIATARLMLPGAGQFREEIQDWFTDNLTQPITIGEINADWRGWRPQLSLKQVQLHDRTGERTITEFDDVWIDLDIMASLSQWRLVPGQLTLSGLQLTIQRNIDGSITIEGLDNAGDNNDINRNALISWLMQQSSLAVKSAEVIWRDLKTGADPIEFDQVALSLRNDGNRHLLEGSTDLPANMGKSIHIALDAYGDLLTSSWSGKLYIEGHGIILDNWPVKHTLFGLDFRDGSIDMKVWSTWENAQLHDLQGQINGRDLHLNAQKEQLSLQSISASVSAQRFKKRGWYIDIGQLLITTGQGVWPESRLYLLTSRDDDHAPFNLEGHFSYLRLGDISNLLPHLQIIPADVRQFIDKLKPEGELRDLRFNYFPLDGFEDELHIRAQVHNLITQPFGSSPGINGLDGVLRSDSDSGSLNIDSVSVQLDYPNLFNQPLELDTVSGKIHWQRIDNGWQVETREVSIANQDIHAALAGKLQWNPENKSPYINLVVHFDNGNMANMSRYLPNHAMRPRVVSWLQTALPAGLVESGGVILHGDMRDFPFDHDEGRFEVRINVDDAILNYHPDWPRIEKMKAEVIFRGRSMDVYGSNGKILGTDIGSVHARIANLSARKPHLTVTGKVHGSAREETYVILNSPLKDSIGKRLQNLKMTGETTVELDLDIPLAHGNQPTIKGAVELRSNTMDSSLLGLTLTDVTGRVEFDQMGLNADRITATLQDRPVTIRMKKGVIKGSSDKPSPATIVTMIGRADRKFLDGQFGTGKTQDGNLLDFLDGTTDWQATLTMPVSWNDKNTPAVLRLESDLKGIAIDLPEPLNKKAEAAHKLTLESTFTRAGNKKIKIKYGNTFNAIFSVLSENGASMVERGELRFGIHPASLPESNEIRVAGQLPRFSISQWYNLVSNSIQSDSHYVSDIVANNTRATLALQNLEVMGQWFRNVKLGINRNNDIWHGYILGDKLQGTFDIPAGDSDSPLRLKFERLELVPLTLHSEQEPFDPAQIPALDIRCKNFVFDKMQLGELAMVTFPVIDGLRLNSLTLNSDSIQIRADGDWITANGEQVSSFFIDVRGKEINSLLSRFGYNVASVKGGETQLEFQVAWSGAPTDFALEKLNGSFRLAVKKGRILEIDPGAGRMFGLLSLQALPRRLSLDFSDLFKRGLAFDRIEGEFIIDDGDAYTNDLHMTSPSARIDIAGRTGLADQDYDQIVTVTPDMAGSLPVAGALVGGPTGLGVAAALVVADKLFRKLGKNKKAMGEQQYTITGSWESPVITPVKKTPDDDSGTDHAPAATDTTDGGNEDS